MFRYVTAGESHGKQLTVILDGIPAGLKITESDINLDLSRRQGGFGRGARMQSIEKDKVEFVSGVRWGETLGSPICLVIKNLDWANWSSIMSSDADCIDPKLIQVCPRPGHADLAGAMKFNRKDVRDILERASARETAARVAAGGIFKAFLAQFKIKIGSFVTEIGGIKADIKKMKLDSIFKAAEKSQVRTPDTSAEVKMLELISDYAKKGDTAGGVFTVVASGVPAGIGSHTQWDKKLDALISRGLISIQAIKGVEFGLGFKYGSIPGSGAHDEIFYSKNKGFWRETNHAGGIEGGISNGEDIIANCVMKPIPSLKKPLRSVNLKTRKAELAEAVRSDVCAVPAASVVGESVLAFEVASAFKEKFGGDSIREIKSNFESYSRYLKNF